MFEYTAMMQLLGETLSISVVSLIIEKNLIKMSLTEEGEIGPLSKGK